MPSPSVQLYAIRGAVSVHIDKDPTWRDRNQPDHASPRPA